MNKLRTLVISVNVTTNAPIEEVLKGIREYVGSMDEVGTIGETDDRVTCEQVVLIVEEDLTCPELAIAIAHLLGTHPKCTRCGRELHTVEEIWALNGDIGCEACADEAARE